MQNHQHHTQQKASVHSSTSAAAAVAFTNTAKLPIETVKLLIASVSRRPNLWIRTSNGQKRSDINALWQQVGQEVHLPADICRIKWGHLRDNFRKVFIRNTLSSEPPTTWRFYNDMRFMEVAVAENVMRQYRLREQSHFWQGLNTTEPHQTSMAFVATAPGLHNNCERSVQNQFNFSELSVFFQNQGGVTPPNKRIKLETSESETSFQGLSQVSPSLLPPANSFLQNDNAYEKLDNLQLHIVNKVNNNADDHIEDEDDDDDDDDDDQFDEDATSIEDNNYQLPERNEKLLMDNKAEIKQKDCNSCEKESAKIFHDEQDADRMFLLSLLPYLRKVREQRKLHVRQKLQDVLIQEFG